MNFIVGNKFELNKKISSGSFGEIYQGRNLKNGSKVAIKLQPINTKYKQLQYEAKLIAYLYQSQEQNLIGIPELYHYSSNNIYNIMVSQILGPNLQQLFQKCNKRFTLNTTIKIALQILNRLELLHHYNFIHRDIKPQNFLIGCNNKCDIIFMIDFGLSKKYYKNGQHITYKDNKHLTGTPRYASLNSHLGIEQSRRDDLESVFYMLIYFLKGKLPWQNLHTNENYQKYQKILEKKLSTNIKNLISQLPKQFQIIIHYIRQLHFIEKPNYEYLKQLFRKCFKQSQEQQELFCWEIDSQQQQSYS